MFHGEAAEEIHRVRDACATRATREVLWMLRGALLRHECDAALYCKTAAGESCAVCLALQASATSQKAQQLMDRKREFFCG